MNFLIMVADSSSGSSASVPGIIIFLVILAAIIVVPVVLYFKNPRFKEAVKNGLGKISDMLPSKELKASIREVSPEELQGIMGNISAVMTSKRFFPQSEGPGYTVYKKQESRGWLVISIQVIIAIILFLFVCIIGGVIYIISLGHSGEKYNKASVLVSDTGQGYYFNIRALRGIKKKIINILEPYLIPTLIPMTQQASQYPVQPVPQQASPSYQQPVVQQPAVPRSTTREQQPSGQVGALLKMAEQQFELLRYLYTSGKFDRDKMVTYISMLEQSGPPLDPQKKSQMLKAGEFMVPKTQSNGKSIDGFEQLRQALAQEHMVELKTFVEVAGTLPPEPASFQRLKHIYDETSKLQYKD